MAKLTKDEALAQLGQSVDVLPTMKYPGVNPETPHQDIQTFQRDLVHGAFNVPTVDRTDYAPPIVFKEDFLIGGHVTGAGIHKFSESANVGEWLATVTEAGGGTAALTIVDGGTNASAQGGWLQIVNAAGAADAVSAQLNGESFKLAVGKPLYFEAKLAVEDVSETLVWIGLMDTATDAYASGVGANNHVGFAIDADGNLDFCVDEGGAGTPTWADTTTNFVDGSLATLETANVVHRVGFYWDGVNTITPYIDGVAGTAVVEGVGGVLIPDATCLTPTFEVQNETTTAETMWIDYIMVVQAR